MNDVFSLTPLSQNLAGLGTFYDTAMTLRGSLLNPAFVLNSDFRPVLQKFGTLPLCYFDGENSGRASSAKEKPA